MRLHGRGMWLAALGLSASCAIVDAARGDDGSSGDDAGDPAPDAPAAAACEPGDRIAAVAAFNASPRDPGNACTVDNVLARDGNPTGLDLFGLTDEGCDRLSDDDLGGCGCVGVDLGGAQALASIVVRAAPIDNACGSACDGSECGTGHTFVAWFGVEKDVYTLAGKYDMTGDQLADYHLEIGQLARFVVVCREWWGADRDDVVVDYIEGVCDG